jgi:phage baseplate assembly protein V
MLDTLRKFIEPLRRRVQMVSTRVKIKRIKEDKAQIEVQKGESYDGILRMEQFGYCYNPPVNSEGMLSSPNGNREDGVLITTSGGEFRIKELAEGEAAIYSSHGQHIVLRKNGDIEVNGAEKVNVNSVEINLEVSDSISANTTNVSLNVEEKTEIITDKFKVENETGELVALQSETNEVLQGSRVLTALGMMPIIPGGRTFGQLQADIDTFK